ncbi:hypothetical protein SO802_013273 [Lithocarpus litseifolius]|uniref:Uncharacterized protein n=1 Tax=Lithocarpus litseifolius TaxID=425828 RepID=A0AAW2D5R7_9ROSI
MGNAYRGNSTYSGVPPRSNEWIKKSYVSESDNLSRPGILDAEGRKMPIMLATPNYTAQGYVAKVETVVEQVRVPLVIQYRNSSPPEVVPVKDYGYKVEPIKENGYKAEPFKDYGYKPEPVKDYGYKPEPVKEYGYKPEPVKDYGYKPQPVKDYGYKPEPVREYGYKPEPVKEYEYKTEPVKEYGYKPEPLKDYGYKPEPVKEYGYKTEPMKNYGYKAEPVKDYGYKAEPRKDYTYKTEPMRDYTYKPANDYGYKAEPMKDYTYKNEPVKEYGKVEPMKDNNYAHDRPREVEDFITNIQTEASRPRRVSPPGISNWPLAPLANRQNGNTGSGDYNNSSNKDWLKPSGNTIRNENNDDYQQKNGNAMEPAMITTGGWVRPSRTTWSTPPPNHPDATLGKPTTDIGTAVDNLKDALKPLYLSTPPSRYTVPVSTTVPKRDAYGETIDSKEAARRYGGAKID